MSIAPNSPAAPRVRVLVVEDSPVSQELLTTILNGDPALQVVGIAANGEAAVAAAEQLRPDVITMDIHMPGLDGYGATRRIMERCPTRIVMVTGSLLADEVAASFRAMESGALAVIVKPPGPGHADYAAARDELLRTVKLMSEVKVVKRWAARDPVTSPPPLKAAVTDVSQPRPRIVAIGASTGGPVALQVILSRLEPSIGAPLVIVQHISPGFADGFTQWLAQASAYDVRVPMQGERLLPGVAYVAPGGLQLTLHPNGSVRLVDEPAEHGFKPSVSFLFRSAAQFGPEAVGVLLTGMGRDGAQELDLMRRAGALTIAQDKASAVVHGMPGEAVKLGAASHVMTPETIALTLNRLLRHDGKTSGIRQ
ncbi:MAG TPA: chemotaxis-specific protein-glutamate methyltransferase CheB [Albitalea sp.]|nr:chemotaxis-specific protein-glutamate methyltransferase CheB [Albitalea sp.]